MHWLLKGGPVEPSVAILNYEPGAGVPRHRHVGLETIVVLEGTQSDENGDYAAGQRGPQPGRDRAFGVDEGRLRRADPVGPAGDHSGRGPT